jgi:hypothetical protein
MNDVQCVDHHHREDLKRITRHVHHDALHRNLLRWSQSNLPRLLQPQRIHLELGRRLAGRNLRFLHAVRFGHVS